MLKILSTPDSDKSAIAARAITYPTAVSHTAVANPLIAQVSTTNPQSWLTTLTKYVFVSSNSCS